MPHYQGTFYRDQTFLFNRREFGRNIPATDIDCLEFDRLEPICLWEAKSGRSSWRMGSSSIAAQYLLAERAGVNYFVAEHNPDWSRIIVCHLSGLDREARKWTPPPIIENETTYDLRGFVKMLYSLRDRNIENELRMRSGDLSVGIIKTWKDTVPLRLEPIGRKQIISELWQELSAKDKSELLKTFLQPKLIK